MTGAYAQQWPGQGAWGEGRGRGERGFEGRGEYGPRGGRHGGGRHEGGRGGGRHGGGRCGRGEGPRFPLEALAGWMMAKGHRHGPRDLDPEDLERIEQLVTLRQMRGGRGPGGPFGGGHRGRGRGRRRRGDVRLAVLRLLSEESRNGYQLMQTIEERSGGNWRPSPGSMYPTLSQLEDEGLIRTVELEGPKRFEITDRGRDALTERSGEPDPWASAEDPDVNAMSELGPLVFGIGKATWQVASVADEHQRALAAELLAETQRRLYGILAQEPSSDAEGSEKPGESAPTED